MIISVDPGDTTGLCLWTEAGDFMSKTKLSHDELTDWCQSEAATGITVIVYEDFLLYAHKAKQQTGSRFVASQVIGALKLLGKQQKSTMVRQPASILRITAMHTGIPIKATGHIDDALSAYLHGYYYLESVGLRRTALQESDFS